MSIIGKLFGVVIDIVEIPIAIAKDIVTVGGTLTEEDKPYSMQKIKELKDDLRSL